MRIAQLLTVIAALALSTHAEVALDAVRPNTDKRPNTDERGNTDVAEIKAVEDSPKVDESNLRARSNDEDRAKDVCEAAQNCSACDKAGVNCLWCQKGVGSKAGYCFDSRTNTGCRGGQQMDPYQCNGAVGNSAAAFGVAVLLMFFLTA